MTTRVLSVRDTSAYRELMLEGFERCPEAFTSSVAERRRWSLPQWQAMFAGGPEPLEESLNRVFGVLEANRLVGALGWRRNTREKTAHKAEVFGLYVTDRARRRGYARDLIDVVVADARAWPGVRLLTLTVSQNNTVAERLYAHVGFQRFGVEPLAVKVAAHRFVAKVHMALDLGADS